MFLFGGYLTHVTRPVSAVVNLIFLAHFVFYLKKHMDAVAMS
jgi:hypothetical protein